MGGGKGKGWFKNTQGGVHKSGKAKRTHKEKEMPQNNQKQNAQAKAVRQKLGLTHDERLQVHQESSKKGWGYQRIHKEGQHVVTERPEGSGGKTRLSEKRRSSEKWRDSEEGRRRGGNKKRGNSKKERDRREE